MQSDCGDKNMYSNCQKPEMVRVCDVESDAAVVVRDWHSGSDDSESTQMHSEKLRAQWPD